MIIKIYKVWARILLVMIYTAIPQIVFCEVNSSDVAVEQDYIITDPIVFDILLDEKIDENDPRMKSIIYVTKQNSDNSILVSYTNPNASDLAGRIMSIMNQYGIKSNSPQLLPSVYAGDLKLVVIKIKYIVHTKPNVSKALRLQNK